MFSPPRSQLHFRPGGHRRDGPLSRLLNGLSEDGPAAKRTTLDERRAAEEAMELLENLAMATKVSYRYSRDQLPYLCVIMAYVSRALSCANAASC